MTVTAPQMSADTQALLVSAKSKADAFSLAQEVLQVWSSIQASLLRAAAAAAESISAGDHPALAAKTLKSNGDALSGQLSRYTSSSNKADIDAALGVMAGLTQEEIDAAVSHLSHGCQQMSANPADGSEAAELVSMIQAYYTAPMTV